MIRELAITASLGVAYKIVTNLVMLPVAASYFSFDQALTSTRPAQARAARPAWLAAGAHRRAAQRGDRHARQRWRCSRWPSTSQTAVHRHVQPGAPELRADARYNRDAVAIASASTSASTC
jgi:hypothetical protein